MPSKLGFEQDEEREKYGDPGMKTYESLIDETEQRTGDWKTCGAAFSFLGS
jgi:hypothetical protein